MEVWSKETYGGLERDLNAYSPNLLAKLKGKLRNEQEVVGLLEGIDASSLKEEEEGEGEGRGKEGLPSRIWRIDKERIQAVIPLKPISPSHSDHLVVEQVDFELKQYQLQSGIHNTPQRTTPHRTTPQRTTTRPPILIKTTGKVTMSSKGRFRSVCVEGGGKEALSAFMEAFQQGNSVGCQVMGYPEWICLQQQ